MFTRLIASRPVRHRFWAESGLSLAGHLALGLGLVRLAGAAVPNAPTGPVVAPIVFRAPAGAETPPVHRPENEAPSLDAPIPPGTVAVAPPAGVPLGLPPIPAGPAIDPRRFVIGPASAPGPGCRPPCRSGSTSDGNPYSEATVDVPVQLIRAPLPVYPPGMRALGLAGRVVLEFVVDTLGKVEAGSIAVIGASHPGFVSSATDAIRDARFVPARIRGRAVRQLVRQGVSFRIE